MAEEITIKEKRTPPKFVSDKYNVHSLCPHHFEHKGQKYKLWLMTEQQAETLAKDPTFEFINEKVDSTSAPEGKKK